jgi:magnesium-transporting ATPase (P-type)
MILLIESVRKFNFNQLSNFNNNNNEEEEEEINYNNKDEKKKKKNYFKISLKFIIQFLYLFIILLLLLIYMNNNFNNSISSGDSDSNSNNNDYINSNLLFTIFISVICINFILNMIDSILLYSFKNIISKICIIFTFLFELTILSLGISFISLISKFKTEKYLNDSILLNIWFAWYSISLLSPIIIFLLYSIMNFIKFKFFKNKKYENVDNNQNDKDNYLSINNEKSINKLNNEKEKLIVGNDMYDQFEKQPTN